MKKIGFLVARDSYGTIGNDDQMPGWNLKSDRKFFQQTRRGNPVIMGRPTYESIPETIRPFKDSTTIVMTLQEFWNPGHPKVQVADSLWKALAMAEEAPGDTTWIIGGSKIYTLALQCIKIDMLYVTDVEGVFKGNVRCPALGEEKGYIRTSTEHFPAGNGNSHSFTISKYYRDDC
jgi:dihydrofolate reductase